MEKVQLVHSLQVSYKQHALCDAFDVSPSTVKYQRKIKQKICPTKVVDQAFVREYFNKSNGSAGSRSIAAIAKVQGHNLSRYRVRSIMKKLNLKSRQPNGNPEFKRALRPHTGIPNRLNRCFNPTTPDQAWCGDITYIWAGRRWHYLAVIMDLYSRKVISWAMSDSPDTDLTLTVLNRAYEARNQPKRVLFHSDQGSHYTSERFQRRIWQLGFIQSLSRVGNCWDNAPMERWFRSLKTEWAPKSGYDSLIQAQCSIKDYILGYYNSVRPSQHNNGLAPELAEKSFDDFSKITD